MNSINRPLIRAAAVLIGLGALYFGWTQTATALGHSGTKERARVVIFKTLPKLDGAHLKAVLVEVQYGPGEASEPHSHPCPVLGYVVEGSLRTQVEGEPEAVYREGESFYEMPNVVHLVSANISSTKPAKFVAYMICEHESPLSVDAPAGLQQKGTSR